MKKTTKTQMPAFFVCVQPRPALHPACFSTMALTTVESHFLEARVVYCIHLVAPGPGPAGPKTKKSDLFFSLVLYFSAKCTKYCQTNCQKTFFDDKKIEKQHCRAKLGEKKAKSQKFNSFVLI